MSCVPPPASTEQTPSFTSVKGCVDVNGTTQKRWPLRDLHPKEQDAACCPFLKQSTPALPQENKDHLYPAQLPSFPAAVPNSSSTLSCSFRSRTVPAVVQIHKAAPGQHRSAPDPTHPVQCLLPPAAVSPGEAAAHPSALQKAGVQTACNHRTLVALHFTSGTYPLAPVII